jgi:hypothetical protein
MPDWRKRYQKATAKRYGSDTISIAFHFTGEAIPTVEKVKKSEGEKFIEQTIAKRSNEIRLIKIETTDVYRPPALIAT